jgi:hypothetical protein
VRQARIVLYAAEGQHDKEIAARFDTTGGSCGSREDCIPWMGLRGCAIGRLRVDRVAVRYGAGRRGQGSLGELPIRHGLPLSRFSRTELHRRVIELAISEASATTNPAVAARRRAQALEAAAVELPSRPRVRIELRQGARPLRPHVRRDAAAAGRVRNLG